MAAVARPPRRTMGPLPGGELLASTGGAVLASGPDLHSYDHYVISLSGGKYSQALLDVLVEQFSKTGVLDRVTTVGFRAQGSSRSG